MAAEHLGTATVALINLIDAGVTATFEAPGCSSCRYSVSDAGVTPLGGIDVAGLPVTLPPFGTAGLILTWAALGDDDPQTHEIPAGRIYYDENPSDFLELKVVGTTIPQCSGPSGSPPIGGTGVGRGGGYDFDFSQDGWQCGGETLADAGLGVSCTSAADCPEICCACPGNTPMTCAGFSAGACVAGTCAPAAVACDAVGSDLAFCPDAGHFTPTAVAGAADFDAGATWSQYGPTDGGAHLSVVVSSRQSGAACATWISGASGSELDLAVALPAGAARAAYSVTSDPAALPVGASAILVAPDGGSRSATSGFVFVSRASASEATGSFDLVFGDGGAAAELWGVFDAPPCGQ